jgi:hypothetical protein
VTNQPKIILEDDIDACDGDQMLGVFMHKLYAWADNTKAELTKINGTRWIGCSKNRWITERKPWSKKVKVSKHQFERMLARGRKMGVLETCQWPARPSRRRIWRTQDRCGPMQVGRWADAGLSRVQCRTGAEP